MSIKAIFGDMNTTPRGIDGASCSMPPSIVLLAPSVTQEEILQQTSSRAPSCTPPCLLPVPLLQGDLFPAFPPRNASRGRLRPRLIAPPCPWGITRGPLSRINGLAIVGDASDPVARDATEAQHDAASARATTQLPLHRFILSHDLEILCFQSFPTKQS